LHLTGTMWWPTTELDDEASQQQKSKLHTSRNSSRWREMCNFMVYRIWPWFTLWHCAAQCAECVTVLYSQLQMFCSCINRWQQRRKNYGLPQFPETLCRRGKRLSHEVMQWWDTDIISFPPVSNQPWSENTLAHPGRRSVKCHHLLPMFCSVFLDLTDVLQEEFLEHGYTVNANS
jgi:hypothetical protein